MIAAENGNDFAEYQLGKIYLYGKDVPRDTDTAMYCLQLAVAHGNQYAVQLIHGTCLALSVRTYCPHY